MQRSWVNDNTDEKKLVLRKSDQKFRLLQNICHRFPHASHMSDYQIQNTELR